MKKAMILAAGLGTRLWPLTQTTPKALIEVGGQPLLERLIIKLKDQGFDYIVVNIHHHGEKIKEFLNSRSFGVPIVISDESNELLDTGGGIVNAYPKLFSQDKSPVLIHNVDILSNADLNLLVSTAKEGVHLLISERDSSRKLIFNNDLKLEGWEDIRTGNYKPEGYSKKEGSKSYAFNGIYTMTKESVVEMEKLMGRGKYSVMDYFLHPERKSEVKGFIYKDLKIIDIGKPTTLSQASDFIF